MHDLATGRYLDEHAPVLIVGPCGTGKSHLAQALGTAPFARASTCSSPPARASSPSLHAARATGAYERKLASLARVPLLIIDDFGLKPLRPPADEDLHDLIAERYETASTIVTSNLDFPEWDQAFPANRLLATATLDRLRHNAYCLVLDGESYRAPKLPPAKAKTKLPTLPKPRILNPTGMSVSPQKTGSITPIIPAPLRRSATLRIEHPVLLGGMGTATSPALVAAVSDADGFGTQSTSGLSAARSHPT